MRIGRYPNGGGRVGGEAWIDGDKCTDVDNAGGSMYLYGQGIVQGVYMGIEHVGELQYTFYISGSALVANHFDTYRNLFSQYILLIIRTAPRASSLK